jgi:hypothetical protein
MVHFPTGFKNLSESTFIQIILLEGKIIKLGAEKSQERQSSDMSIQLYNARVQTKCVTQTWKISNKLETTTRKYQ